MYRSMIMELHSPQSLHIKRSCWSIGAPYSLTTVASSPCVLTQLSFCVSRSQPACAASPHATCTPGSAWSWTTDWLSCVLWEDRPRCSHWPLTLELNCFILTSPGSLSELWAESLIHPGVQKSVRWQRSVRRTGLRQSAVAVETIINITLCYCCSREWIKPWLFSYCSSLHSACERESMCKSLCLNC